MILFGYIEKGIFTHTEIGTRGVQPKNKMIESVERIKKEADYARMGLRTVKFLVGLGSFGRLPYSLAEAEQDVLKFQDPATLEVGDNTESIFKALHSKGDWAIAYWDDQWWVYEGENFTQLRNFLTPYEKYERKKWYYSKGRVIATIEDYHDWYEFLMDAEDDGLYFRGFGYGPRGPNGKEPDEIVMDEVKDLDKWNVEQWLPMLVLTDFDDEPCYDDNLDIVRCTMISKAYIQ